MKSRPLIYRRGFLLLEMILALAIFGIAATAFAVALKRMAQAANMAQSELRITGLLDNALDETISIPLLEEGENTTNLGDTGIKLTTKIELIDDLENQDGQRLQEMYAIYIKARWYEADGWKEREVSTWRYGKMYQP